VLTETPDHRHHLRSLEERELAVPEVVGQRAERLGSQRHGRRQAPRLVEEVSIDGMCGVY
jgi:hypothetical protein